MSTYHQKKKEKLLNRAKEYYKIIKKDCQSNEKINIGNYVTNKKIKKENMEEIDIKICLKNISKD